MINQDTQVSKWTAKILNFYTYSVTNEENVNTLMIAVQIKTCFKKNP